MFKLDMGEKFMKKLKLLSTMLLVGTMTLGMCTGGGSKGKEGTDSGETQSNKTEDVVLTYYGFSDWVTGEGYKEVYEEAVKKFEDENPGFKIELQSDPWGDWEMKYKTMFASGNTADIFIVNNPDFPTFANAGNLLDFSQYTEEGYLDDFFPDVAKMYNWQGKQMAIPFTTDCRILWYNKDIFTEAGLDPTKPPKTWDEMIQYANTITEKTGKYGFGMDLGLKEFPMQAAFCASNGSIINVSDSGEITPNVNTPEFKKYLQMLADMKPTFEPDYATLNHHDVAKQFVEGQFGMIIGNTLVDTDIYSKDFYAQALVPTMDANSPNGSFGGGFGIAVNNNTKYPEQAVKFAQILCSPEFNSRLISDIPASNKGLEASSFAADSRYEVILQQIKTTRQAQPKTLYYAEIEAAIYDTVAEVLLSGKDIDEAVGDLESKINDIVK